MPQCQLCKHDRALCKSHIIPEFLWSDLYNAKHQVKQITGKGPKGWKPIQKGIREELFCNDCEQYINKHFEQPFKRMWVDDFPLPDPWVTDSAHWVSVDYAPFKLFHLSVLYRAHVSTCREFATVSLSRHAEILRNMLLTLAPGSASQYPIFGWAIIDPKTRKIMQGLSGAQTGRFGGKVSYGLMYGGVEWWICVSSDHTHEFQQAALQSNGRMPFIGVPWDGVSILKAAVTLLPAPPLLGSPQQSSR